MKPQFFITQALLFIWPGNVNDVSSHFGFFCKSNFSETSVINFHKTLQVVWTWNVQCSCAYYQELMMYRILWEFYPFGLRNLEDIHLRRQILSLIFYCTGQMLSCRKQLSSKNFFLYNRYQYHTALNSQYLVITIMFLVFH